MINSSCNWLSAITAAAALSSISFAAQAANVNIVDTTGTAGITNVAAATDGIIPPDFTEWTTDSAYWTGFGETLTLKFDQAYYLSSLTLTADWNDYYTVSVSTDDISYVDLGTYTGIGSPVNFGQVTLPVALAPSPTAFSFAKVTAVLGGDGSNSVGEISFQGVTAAVPEPETYAMLLAGLGVVGFMGKRRRAS